MCVRHSFSSSLLSYFYHKMLLFIFEHSLSTKFPFTHCTQNNLTLEITYVHASAKRESVQLKHISRGCYIQVAIVGKKESKVRAWVGHFSLQGKNLNFKRQYMKPSSINFLLTSDAYLLPVEHRPVVDSFKGFIETNL